MAAALRTYHLFISHGWKYTDDYYRMVEYLEKLSQMESRFGYDIHSEPESEKGKKNRNTEELMSEMQSQIRDSECVFILSDMYKEYHYWLDYAMDLAKDWDIPIIGVRTWGDAETPYQIEERADEMVEWHDKSILTAIRNQCRMEQEPER
ncbi:MAG TPA: TIR domain-containing protein [Balneolales bacterium]|nr:TIR domain-containing protein [Balneolales bacterium]